MTQKKFSLAFITILLFCLIAWGSYQWFFIEQYIESTDDAYIQADKITISSKLQGYLQAEPVQDNQPVKKGTLLARIRAEDYKDNLKLSQATVNAAIANIAAIKAKLVLQKSAIHEAKAAIAADYAALQQTIADVKRYSHLNQSGYSSQRELESAHVAKAAALAKLQQARADLETQKKQIDVLKAELTKSIAAQQGDEASLDKARNDLNYIKIIAPTDSILAQRLVHDGEYITPSAALFSLIQLNTVWVTANFKETQISNLRIGQKVKITVDGFPSQPIVGYINSFAPGSGSEFSILPPENATGNFTKIVQRIPVKIAIPPRQILSGHLRPGMSVTVSINTKDTQLVPTNTDLFKIVPNNIVLSTINHD